VSFALSFRRFPDESGAVEVARVPWDSEIFELPVHELRFSGGPSGAVGPHLRALLEETARERPNLIVAKVPLGSTALSIALAEAGFYAVETMVELALPLARYRPAVDRLPAGLRLRAAKAEDLEGLAAIARTTFHADRFHLDPNLPSDKADLRYERWLRRGFAAGDPVFAFEDGKRGRLLGFFHVRLDGERQVDLSLAGLEPSARRIGLGVFLYQAVLEECRARGLQTAITRVSVNNLDVVNLFMRLGFSARSPSVVLHRYTPLAAHR
jgi:ribosomal protein S18 acetylase RimI-like enzyme